jgi:hypothetical protein
MSTVATTLDCRLLHICAQVEELEDSAVGVWKDEPRLIHDSTGENSCLVGCIPEGVVMAFRGTEPINDPSKPLKERLGEWVGNFEANLRPSGSLPGMVHHGWASAVEDMWPQIEERLFKLLFPGAAVIATGHSKGGAEAVLAAAKFQAEMPNLAEVIQVLTFGAPRAGNDDFATSFNTAIPACQRIEYGRDLVPHLPAHSNLLAIINNVTNRVIDYVYGSDYVDVNYAPVGALTYFDANGILCDADGYRGKLSEAERLAGITETLVTLDFKRIVEDHRISKGSGYQKGVCGQ